MSQDLPAFIRDVVVHHLLLGGLVLESAVQYTLRLDFEIKIRSRVSRTTHTVKL